MTDSQRPVRYCDGCVQKTAVSRAAALPIAVYGDINDVLEGDAMKNWKRHVCTAAGMLLATQTEGHGGGLAWSDRPSGVRSIRASGFDGSGVRTLVSGLGDPRGVAIDGPASVVYFTDRQNGTATSGELSSVPLAGGVRMVHLGQLNRPADLRFEEGSRVLYWCEENAGLIRRAEVPDSGEPWVATSIFSGLSSPYFLDLDVGGGRLVWGTSGNSLNQGPLAGGVPDPPLYTSGQNMRGVGIDPERGMVYWVERDGARAIRRRSLEGGPVEDVYTGLDTPHGLVLDLPARRLYWVDTGSQNAGGFNPRGVSRGHMEGSTAEAPEIVVAGTASDQPWDIDLDPRVGSYLEWSRRFFRFDAAASLTDPLADPDADELNNFGEYALDGRPMSAASTGRFEAAWVEEGGMMYATVSYPERASANDVRYQVEVSDGLGSWKVAEDLQESHRAPADAQGMEWVTLRMTAPIGSAGARYFRVHVSAVAGG